MHFSGETECRGRGAAGLRTAPCGRLATGSARPFSTRPFARCAFAIFAATSFAATSNGALAGEARTISLLNIHTDETLTITFKRDGHFIPAALKKINWHLRDWRRDSATEMDPDLIDLVWEIHREVGSKMPVRVISGYRSPATNEMLRKTRGGQARRSQHLLGKAMDVQFPDVPIRTLRYSALIREQGGVGYYPTSATPFVHIDTGRVRHWPRMNRQELALLFPSGRTRHRPSSGGPVTPADTRKARHDNPALARTVMAFQQARHNGTLPAAAATQVASAAPRLVARPRPATRPPMPQLPAPVRASLGLGGWSYSFKPAVKPAPPTPAAALALTAVPDANPALKPPPTITAPAQGRLARLASLISGRTPPPPAPARSRPTPKWVSAPAFDEEHPEELFYRPFPIGPYITHSDSADDPALQRLVHPAIDETLEYLVADGTPDRPLQLRPGPSTANLLWALAFSGGTSPPPAAIAAAGGIDGQKRRILDRHLIRLAGRR